MTTQPPARLVAEAVYAGRSRPGREARTVKRDPALVALSGDHHLALYVARTLKRATADTASDARAAFADYSDEHGRGHFRLEEEILLPAYAPHGDPHHPLIARALCDHVAIRARANELLADDAPDPAVLHELGTILQGHIRLEERELRAHRGRAPRRKAGRGGQGARPRRALRGLRTGRRVRPVGRRAAAPERDGSQQQETERVAACGGLHHSSQPAAGEDPERADP